MTKISRINFGDHNVNFYLIITYFLAFFDFLVNSEVYWLFFFNEGAQCTPQLKLPEAHICELTSTFQIGKFFCIFWLLLRRCMLPCPSLLETLSSTRVGLCPEPSIHCLESPRRGKKYFVLHLKKKYYLRKYNIHDNNFNKHKWVASSPCLKLLPCNITVSCNVISSANAISEY